MSEEYDVIVVGAGPAGSICARSLGMGGANVLLIDKDHFPRDKPCGDLLSPRLCDRLKLLGLLDSIKNVPHCPIDDLLFSHPRTGSFLLKDSLTRTTSNGLMCKRQDLDAVLFEEAKKHVQILAKTKVNAPLFDNGRIVGVQTENKTYRAKIVVGADGANGVMAKALGTAAIDDNHHAVSVRAYFSHIKGLTNSVELHFINEVQPGYFWIFPTNLQTGEANVGLGILSRNVRNRNVQLKNLLDQILKTHPQFQDRFAEAQCVAPTKGWSLPFGSKKRPVVFPGAILIGDAAGLIDPMSGEGIENAVRSGVCAAKALLNALAIDDCSPSTLKMYEVSLEDLLRPELRKGYYIQKIARNPVMLRLIFLLLSRSKFCRRFIANKFF